MVKQFETVSVPNKTGYHNTVCDKKCNRICHLNCKVPFKKDSAELVACVINNNGSCNKCGCPTVNHTHAMIEYIDEKRETVEYKNLMERIN
jgi:hypothetical protein